MPFKLHKPGTRKGNKFIVARGSFRNTPYEISTRTVDRAKAKTFAEDYEAGLAAERPPETGETVTFEIAARAFLRFRPRNTEQERGNLEALIKRWGEKPIKAITHAMIIAAAEELKGGRSNATKNRAVVAPAAAVMHYAARPENGWCSYVPLPYFRQKEPETRAVTETDVRTYVSTLRDPYKRLAVVWMATLGNRVSDTCRAAWDGSRYQIDMVRGEIRYWNRKVDKMRTKPIPAVLHRMLSEVPLADRHGKVFPWAGGTVVTNWMWRHSVKCGVKITPHMLRHSVGRWLAQSGASNRAIMDQLDHSSLSTSQRYQSIEINHLRSIVDGALPDLDTAAGEDLGKMLPKPRVA